MLAEAVAYTDGPIAHMIAVAAGVDLLGRELGLPPAVITNLVLAALTHDASKRLEVKKGQAEAAIPRAELIQRIEDMGWFEAARLAQCSGHDSMRRVLQELTTRSALSAEALFFLVDNMAVGARFKPCREKTAYLLENADRYPYNDDGLAIFGQPFFSFQGGLADVLEAAVAQQLGLSPLNGLAHWLNERLELP